MKAEARFDQELHNHLLYVRDKLVAHNDGEQLPPTLHVLSIAVDQDPLAGTKPILATARSYSLSSARGARFHAALQEHSEACIDGMKHALHEGVIDYLTEAQIHREAFAASGEYDGAQKGIALRFTSQGPVSKTLLGLDELTEKTISVPEGNVHNKAYTYRMLTYSAALPGVQFRDLEGKDVEFYLAAKPRPLLLSEKPRRVRMFGWLQRIINWGIKPL